MRLVRATDKGMLYKSHGVMFFCWCWDFEADIPITSVGFDQQRLALPATLKWDILPVRQAVPCHTQLPAQDNLSFARSVDTAHRRREKNTKLACGLRRLDIWGVLELEIAAGGGGGV